MQQWDYKIVKLPVASAEEILDNLGKDCWEAVQAFTDVGFVVVILKRRVEEK
jgi:hypothetical protein